MPRCPRLREQITKCNLRSRASELTGCSRPSSICLSKASVTPSERATLATSDNQTTLQPDRCTISRMLLKTLAGSSFSALTLLVGSFDPLKPVPDMTYNVFGGTLSLTLSIYLSWSRTVRVAQCTTAVR